MGLGQACRDGQRLWPLRGPVAARAARTDRGHRGDRHRGWVGGGTGWRHGRYLELVHRWRRPRSSSVSPYDLHYEALRGAGCGCRDGVGAARMLESVAATGRRSTIAVTALVVVGVVGLTTVRTLRLQSQVVGPGGDYGAAVSALVSPGSCIWRPTSIQPGSSSRTADHVLAPETPPYRRPLRRPECRRAEFGESLRLERRVAPGPRGAEGAPGVPRGLSVRADRAAAGHLVARHQGVPRGAVPGRRRLVSRWRPAAVATSLNSGSRRPPRPCTVNGRIALRRALDPAARPRRRCDTGRTQRDVTRLDAQVLGDVGSRPAGLEAHHKELSARRRSASV